MNWSECEQISLLFSVIHDPLCTMAAAPRPARAGWEKRKLRKTYANLGEPIRYTLADRNDEGIKAVYRSDRVLADYFARKRILLNPNDLTTFAIMTIESGERILHLARHRRMHPLVACLIKLPMTNTTPAQLRELLYEYMYQTRAREILIRNRQECSVPEVIGLIHLTNPSRYCLVTRLACYQTDTKRVLTLDHAIQHQKENPSFSVHEMFQLLMKVVAVLQLWKDNNIYHNDLKLSDVCLMYTNEDTFRPVITSFRHASTRRNDEMRARGRHSFFMPEAPDGHRPAHRPPELYEQVDIHPESIVYSSAYLLSKFAGEFGLRALLQYLNGVMERGVEVRPPIHAFIGEVQRLYRQDRPGTPPEGTGECKARKYPVK